MYIARRPAHPCKLTQGKEYEAVLARGVRLSGKRFVLRAAPNPAGSARLGMITSRKAAKRAVDRNRAKRLTRELFRATKLQLPAWDMVIQLRNDLRTSNNREVRVELARLFQDIMNRAAVHT